jgi:hypothetical protein
MESPMCESTNESVQAKKTSFFESLLASKYSNHISVLLASFSLLLWAVSIVQAKRVEMGDYGLFSVLPVTYYAAVFLLLLSMFYTVFSSKYNVNRNYMGILLFQSLILMCFMLFTPTLIEGTARSPHSWMKYGYADYIVRNGHISQAVTYYHNWPAPFIYSAEIVLTSSIGPTVFPAVFPLLLDFMVYTIVLIFFLRFFKDIRARYFGIMLFFLITWENQFHFVPQFIGFVLLLLILYLGIFYLKRQNIKMMAVIGMLFIILILTHLLTAFVAGVFLGLITLTTFWPKAKAQKKSAWRRRWFRRLFIKKFWHNFLKKLVLILVARKKTVALIAIVTIGGVLVWFMFAQDWIRYANWGINLNIVPMLVKAYIEKLYTGSEAHGNLVLIRFVFSALIVLFAIIGGKLAYDKGHTRTMYVAAIAGILPIFLFYYEVEIVQRSFLFCGLALAVLISLGVNNKKFVTFVIILCFLAVPLHTLAMYGNEKIDYTPPSQIPGAEFVFDNIPEGVIISGNPVEGSQYIERYTRTDINRIEGYLHSSYDVYVVYSSSEENFAQWYLGDENYISQYKDVINQPGCMLIFSSPDCQIYKFK